MYYRDLSPYEYGELPGGCSAVFNVGWLDTTEPYVRGPLPEGFTARLAELVKNGRVNLMRGSHACPFCLAEIRNNAAMNSKAIIAELEDRAALGNGEIVVIGTSGVCLAAPALVLHYAERHGYRPPDVFIEAVMQE